MNWPFELPSMPILVRTDGNLTPREAREWADACITAALQWAAEEVRREALIELHNRCIPASAAVADAVRSRVRSILLRE